MRKGIVQYGVSDKLCHWCQYRYRADLPAGCYGRCRGRELVQHGSALFPIACYAENLKSYSVAWHWHEEFEYILAMKGPLTVDVNKTRVTLQTNQGVFLNSGILHAVEQAEKGEALLHSGVFHPRLVGGMDTIFWQKLIRPMLQPDAPAFFSAGWGCALAGAGACLPAGSLAGGCRGAL